MGLDHPNNPQENHIKAITHTVDGPWPNRVQIIIDPAMSTERAYAQRTRTIQPRVFTDLPRRPAASIDIVIGAASGVRIASLAHEANHAALWVMTDPHWENWAPRWTIRAQKEETTCYIIEQVVRTGILMVEKYDLKIDNSYRHVSTWTWVSAKELL